MLLISLYWGISTAGALGIGAGAKRAKDLRDAKKQGVKVRQG